jgi:hypothetical protein
MQHALKLQPDFEPAPLRPPFKFKLVIYVFYSGALKGELRGQNLYDPPLDRALATVIDECGARLADVQLLRGDNANEPPTLQNCAVLVRRTDALPLAWMTTHQGEAPLDFDALHRAFQAIGGRE